MSTAAQLQHEGSEVAAMALDAANRLFSGEVTRERMARADRGEWQAEIWTAVEQAGLPLALVPEALGGVGLPIAQGLQLIRRSGYHTVPVPLAETMLAALAWAEAGGAALAGPATLGPVRPEDALELEIGLTDRPHGRERVRMCAKGRVVRVDASHKQGWQGVAVTFDEIVFERNSGGPAR